jgi:hypothetical protein
MTVGGRHKGSKVNVARGLGWDASIKLWYRTFTNLHPQASFHDAALSQVAEAARNKPDQLQTVACAWHAVGVINPLGAGFHPALQNVTCPAKMSSCEGISDGLICDSQASFAVLRCKDGKFVNMAASCNIAGGKTKCRHPSDDDYTAAIGPDGYAVCD